MVKQAVNKQNSDKVPLIVICIDNLTTNSVDTVKQCSITVYSTEHNLFLLNF